MKLFAILIVCLMEIGCMTEAGNNWALLVAGSEEYWNYRHQADVCHAYQVLHESGIPDERIVVMMFDDIADNMDNPIKGKIFNKRRGDDVYKGVPKDYTGGNTNTDVFFAVLKGDKARVKELTGRDGKVIESGPGDNIFIFYSDHGSTGILGMPTGRYIKSGELNQVIKKMHTDNRFSKMLFYLEACNSGSMFDQLLPNDINVYAATAATPTEPSYACYWDNTVEAWLGDEFSVAWMEDSETADISARSLDEQFTEISRRVTMSTPMRYGTMSMKSDRLDQFMAGTSSSSGSYGVFGQRFRDMFPHSNVNVTGWHGETSLRNESKKESTDNDRVASEFVPISVLRRRLEKTPKDSPMRAKVERDLEQMETTLAQTYDLFWQIAKIAVGETPKGDNYKLTFGEGQTIDNYACYYEAVDLLSDVCSKVNTNVNSLFLRNFYVLNNLCNHQPTEKVFYAVKSTARFSPLCY